MLREPPAASNDVVTARDFVPARKTLENLRHAATRCQGCELYRQATQTVFGEGNRHASIVFVGEQPGDQEDRSGQPFVGPAGKLLSQALEAAELSREQVYITNAVKHFYWQAAGTRRLHKKPQIRHIEACEAWLSEEIRLISPEILVCLGATAARAVFGRSMTIREDGGKILSSPYCEQTVILVHPSALLRIPGKAARTEAFLRYVESLRQIGGVLKRSLPQAG